jgi:hypothetical protein
MHRILSSLFMKVYNVNNIIKGEEVLSVATKQGALDEISGLRYNLGGPNAMPALAGKMRLTNYRIILKTLKGNRGARHRMPEAFEELHIPYGTIAKIEEQVLWWGSFMC